MIPRRRTPRYREVPSTRWVRTKRRCQAAWLLWYNRKYLVGVPGLDQDGISPGKRALKISLRDGVCHGCFDLEEITFCGTCGRGTEGH
jgi:hypothetical protein